MVEPATATTVSALVGINPTNAIILSNGGTLNVTINDAGTAQSLALHLNAAGQLVDSTGVTPSSVSYNSATGVVTLTEAAPGNGNTLSVSAAVVDSLGNSSNVVNTSATE